ncbi:MAG: PorT family protein [Phycisphaerae bacterium]|nr:PorT family protein [Saprospiraceae bacterium]
MNILSFKKLCLIFGATLLFTGTSIAQGDAEDQRTSFGIRAGVNFQNINGKDGSGDKLENELATRFHVGVQADIPIAPEFYFQPGLLFTTKGAKNETINLEQPAPSDLNISYLELPLNFLYKPMLGNGHLLLGVGPYVAYGIGGKAKFEGGGTTLTQDVKFDNTVTLPEVTEDYYVRPFDAGANLFVGYQFVNGLFFQLNTQLGLMNINPDFEGVPENDSAYKNTGFGLSVGYGF